MREYELTYLGSDEVLEKDLNKITGKVSELILAVDGRIKKEEIWGRRKLAYPIKKQNFANYITLWAELPATGVAKINQDLQSLSEILRHLLIIKTGGSEKIVVTKKDVVGDEELEAIIGDKSVEIVKGESKESYDLMAKRETEDEPDENKSKIKEEEEAKDKGKKTKTIAKEKSENETDKKTEPETTEKKKKTDKSEKKSTAAKPKKTTTKAKKEKKQTEQEETVEADRIKKLDEKLDELLTDDI
jgi:small subunit ribosomal protein S6